MPSVVNGMAATTKFTITLDWRRARVGGRHPRAMTRPILVDSCRLPLPFHVDPADQTIVATTRALPATLW